MEKETVERMVAMRRQGASYLEIAKAAGFPIGTVKSALSRRAAATGQPACEWCGKPVWAAKGKRRKRFCCDACRFKWHKRNPNPGKTTICANCGRPFPMGRDKGRKYCSQECYWEARNGKAR